MGPAAVAIRPLTAQAPFFATSRLANRLRAACQRPVKAMAGRISILDKSLADRCPTGHVASLQRRKLSCLFPTEAAKVPLRAPLRPTQSHPAPPDPSRSRVQLV